jgi:hypothetical protein
MTTTPLFGPAWAGWQSYNDFAESVKTELRFVRSKLSEQFLAEVRASCLTRKVTIPKDKALWRARLGCEHEDVTTHDPDITVVVP